MKNLKPLKIMFTTAALAVVLTGCGSDSDTVGAVDTIDDTQDPVITDPVVTTAELTVFAQSVEGSWSTWGEGDVLPVQVTDVEDSYGEAIEFGTSGAVVSGFSTRADKGGSDAAYDASAFANTGTLDFDLKMVVAPPSTNVWKLKVEGSGAPVEIDIDTPTLDTWVHYTFPLSSLGDVSAINNIMIFPNWADNAGALYRVDNVQFFATGAINSNSGGSLTIDVATGVDFEGAEGAQASWETFENGDPSPSLEFVTNPDTTGNNSATVAKLNLAASDGGMWAGVKVTTVNTFALDASNAIVKIWVYKNKISPVGIKFEKLSGAAHAPRFATNTLINQWEQLTIDFTDDIGLPENGAIEAFAIYPDNVDGRTAETVYFDNITFGSN